MPLFNPPNVTQNISNTVAPETIILKSFTQVTTTGGAQRIITSDVKNRFYVVSNITSPRIYLGFSGTVSQTNFAALLEQYGVYESSQNYTGDLWLSSTASSLVSIAVFGIA